MTIETTSGAGQLAQIDPTPSQVVNQSLFDWVAGMKAAMEAADFLVDTPAVPDSFWPLPAGMQVSKIPGKNPKLRLPNEDEQSYQTRRRIAVQTAGYVVRYGLGLNLHPEQALRDIFVIGGRPAMYSEGMVSLIKARGHKHRVVIREADRCVVEVKHRDETEWEAFEFTLEDAIRAGYVPGQGPNKGKDWGGNQKYLTDPKTMLQARASSIACKTKFPDELRGTVTKEEIEDEQRTTIEGTVEDIPAPPKISAAAILAKSSKAPAEPEPVDERAAAPSTPPAASAPAPKGPEKIRPAQVARISAAFDRLNVTDSGERIAIAAATAGRVIELATDLTASEGTAVVDQLEKVVKMSAADADAWVDQQLEHAATLDRPAPAAEQPGGARG